MAAQGAAHPPSHPRLPAGPADTHGVASAGIGGFEPPAQRTRPATRDCLQGLLTRTGWRVPSVAAVSRAQAAAHLPSSEGAMVRLSRPESCDRRGTCKRRGGGEGSGFGRQVQASIHMGVCVCVCVCVRACVQCESER